jgi:hypothetical protein
MKISISIMAHPKRKGMVDDLLKIIPNTPVAWDRKNNIWDTCKRAWQLYNPNADFHLVIQDDAILCKDFLNEINKFPNKDRVYSLYIGNREKFKKSLEKAKRKGYEFLVKKNIHHEIALMFPTKRVKEMLDYCDTFNPETDKIINQYVIDKGLKVYIKIPTLIDHRVGESLYKLNKSDFNTRKSIWFKG